MYLRDLDLRGEIWGGCRFTKSSRFLYHPHTQTQSGLAFWLKWSGTMCGTEQFLSFFLYVLTETVLIKFWLVDLQVNRTFSLQDESNKCTFRSVWYVHYIVMALFFPSLHQSGQGGYSTSAQEQATYPAAGASDVQQYGGSESVCRTYIPPCAADKIIRRLPQVSPSGEIQNSIVVTGFSFKATAQCWGTLYYCPPFPVS